MKTLKEKRNIYYRNLLEDAFGDNINLVNDIFIEIKEQDKEFIEGIFDEIDKGIKLTIKLYNHKKGEELGAEIYDYLYKKIKNNSGFEE